MSRRILGFFAPAIASIGVALVCASYYVKLAPLAPSPTVPHVLVMLASLVWLYAGAWLVTRFPYITPVRSLLLAIVTTVFSTFWIAFYVVLFSCLFAYSDIPTVKLLVGYASLLGTLKSIARPSQMLALLALVALLLLAVAVVSFFLWKAFGEPLQHWREERKRMTSTEAVASVLAMFVAFEGGPTIAAIKYSPSFIAAGEPVTRMLHDRPLHAESYVGAHYGEISEDAAEALSYQVASSPAARNVIVMYVDALRADLTQPYGYPANNMPFVTAMVKNGTLRQAPLAIAACPATMCGIGALLQSRPAHQQNPRYFSLPRVLHRHGYRLAYVLSSDHQSFYDLKLIYGGNSIDFYRDGRELDPARSTDDFNILIGLRQLGPAQRDPTFLFLGLVSTHVIGARADRFRVFEPSTIGLLDLLNPSPATLDRFRNHYLNGVLQADEVIRLAWTWLDEHGYLQDAIVVITSDHGESMGEHGKIGHGKSLRHTELNIPLWIYDSRQAIRLPEVVRQVDIAPLVLDRLGLPVPRTWTGRRVDVESSDEWSEHLYSVQPSSVAVIRSRPGQVLKYLREADAEYMFDLLTDADERLNVISRVSPQERAEFQSRADALQAAIQRDRVMH